MKVGLFVLSGAFAILGTVKAVMTMAAMTTKKGNAPSGSTAMRGLSCT